MSNTRSRNRLATIMEVASLAGVSFKTVARVVNNEGSVRPQTREAVQHAMKMLGYVPNLSARQLAGQRSFLMAFAFRTVATLRASHAYLAMAQEGAQRRCRDAGYSLVIEEIPPGAEEETATRLQALRVAGVILPPPLSGDPPTLLALTARGLPYVLISPDEPPAAAPSVRMDDRRAAFEMTRRLIELGHRRVGFIGVSEWPAARPRREGYIEALKAAGLARDPQLEADAAFDFRSGEAAACRLLDLAQPPTAIFAANDDMALGAMVCAARRGVRVPAELSIAGFDDSPSAVVVWPPLTTIRQPIGEMAATAVDLLLDSAAPSASLQRVLDFELVERGSAAAPGHAPGADTLG